MPRSWLQRLVWLYDYDTPRGWLAYAAIASSAAGAGWGILEASGVPGSPKVAAGLIILGILAALLTFLFLSLFRWPLLAAAIKSYVFTHLSNRIDHTTVLVGIGPGGAIAAGLVAKAFRALHREPPSVVIVDHRYDKLGADPTIAKLGVPDLSHSNCWIIQGHIGTGRSLNLLRHKLNLQNAPVFAFVVSPEALHRERIDALLVVGTRRILPWPTEKAQADS